MGEEILVWWNIASSFLPNRENVSIGVTSRCANEKSTFVRTLSKKFLRVRPGKITMKKTRGNRQDSQSMILKVDCLLPARQSTSHDDVTVWLMTSDFVVLTIRKKNFVRLQLDDDEVVLLILIACDQSMNRSSQTSVHRREPKEIQSRMSFSADLSAVEVNPFGELELHWPSQNAIYSHLNTSGLFKWKFLRALSLSWFYYSSRRSSLVMIEVWV